MIHGIHLGNSASEHRLPRCASAHDSVHVNVHCAAVSRAIEVFVHDKLRTYEHPHRTCIRGKGLLKADVADAKSHVVYSHVV
jgi:hypothetical protein